MEKEQYGTKEYWKNHLDSVLKTLEEDKDKLVDIIMNNCICMDILIPFRIGEEPRYEVNFSKIINNNGKISIVQIKEKQYTITKLP